MEHMKDYVNNAGSMVLRNKRNLPGAGPHLKKLTLPFRILLVEDDPIVRKVHTMMLTKRGYEVDVVEDGQQAIEKTNQRYSLILMDIRMSIMDGITATKEIRRLEGGAKRTPIIGLTCDSEEEVKNNCLLAGMDGFITKPVTMDSLQRTVKIFIY